MPFLMLLATALFIPALPSGSSSPRWWVLVMGAALLAGSIRGLPALPRWLWLVLIISTGWTAATLLWAPSLWDSSHTLLKWSVLLVLMLAVREELLERGWDWAAAGMWVVLLTQLLLWSGLIPDQPGSVPPHGGFYNKNFMGDAAALILVAQLFRPHLSWPLLVAPAAALWLSGSAVAIGAAFGGAVLALAWRQRWTLRTWLGVGPLLGSTAALGFLYVIDNLRPSSWVHRLEIWSATIPHLSVFGHGPGAYSFFFPEWERAHNDMLELAFDLGLGVSGVLIMLAWMVLRGGLQRERAVLVCFLGIGLFTFPLHNPATALLAAVAAGGLLRSSAILRDVQFGLGAHRSGGIPAGWLERPLGHLQPTAGGRRSVSSRSKSSHRARGLHHEPN